MALTKSITNEFGIVGNYHRIKSIEIFGDMIHVTIYSYADESYREKEKSRFENEKKIKDQIAYMNTITDLDLLKKEEEKLKNLQSQWDYKQYYIFETLLDVSLPEESEISFTNIYNKLKKIDPFKDAIDA